MKREIPIILASASPRRKELLQALDLEFTTHPSTAEETFQEGMTSNAIVEMLSLRKAESVATEYSEGLVIGSDTIVVLDGEVLGKPRDETDALWMLAKLQGRDHSVFSGIAIVDAASGRSMVKCSETKVYIKSLTEQQIQRYIATGEFSDKAGAYAIQGFGATFVEKIEGDYFTVVGLPIGLLSDMLSEFGVAIY